VPTPVDRNKRPDLTPLVLSSTTVGKYMPKNSIIVYESTVYPGVTEDECVPLLEKNSGLEYLRDFRVGYSPKRINDGMGKYVADAEEVRYEYGLEILPSLEKLPAVDAVVVAGFCRKGATPIVVDIKGMFDPETATKQGVRYWRL